MDYEGFFNKRLDALRSEGRYRVFKRSTFPALPLREETPMRRDTRTLVRAAFATALGVLSVPLAGPIEARAQPVDLPANVPAYNPYPSGILPANLQSELDRVKREVET